MLHLILFEKGCVRLKKPLFNIPDNLPIKTIGICAVVFLGGVVLGTLSSRENPNQENKTLVTYKDGEITSSELGNFMSSVDVSDKYLDDLIEDKIIELEADRLNVSITEDEKNSIVNKLIAGFGGEKAFNDYLSYYKISKESLLQQNTNEALLKKIILKDNDYSKKDLKKYFEKNVDKFIQNSQFDYSEIVVSDKGTAEEIYKRLELEENFGELAVTYSETDSAGNKGRIGFISEEELSDDKKVNLEKLEIGKYSKVFEDELGYTIVLLNGKKEATELKFDDVEDKVKEAYEENVISDNHKKWLSEAKKRYNFTSIDVD